MCCKAGPDGGETGSDEDQVHWTTRTLAQFKYNVYIRYYMLVYFDFTFFAVMKIIEGDNTTTGRKAAVLLSYILFVTSIILPVYLVQQIFKNFQVLQIKRAKESFNALVLKIDKGSKVRVMNVAYFFGRRFLTALILTVPLTNTFIFLQYVLIMASSHAYILYIVAVKPYQTLGYNLYVLANEVFYSAIFLAIFIFTDAVPETNVKVGAGYVLIVSLICLGVINVIMMFAQVFYGGEIMKKTIKDSKLKREEKEALYEA